MARFQFSLRSLLLSTAGVAVLIAFAIRFSYVGLGLLLLAVGFGIILSSTSIALLAVGWLGKLLDFRNKNDGR